MSHRAKNRQAPAGFSLAEMLVAVAIFMTLMSGIVMLFAGSLRAYRVSQQQMDAFEEARGALTIFNTDLASAFEAGEHYDGDTFYGCPNGMTFIGLIRTSDDTGDLNIARITYVLYNPAFDRFTDSPSVEVFENALVTRDPDTGAELDEEFWATGFTYPLLRYVEPGVSDLDSFPVDWEFRTIDGGSTLAWHLEDEVATARQNGLCDTCEDEFRRAKRREYWIRMLAGGGLTEDGSPLPNAWEFSEELMGLPPGDAHPYFYIVTANVLSIADPDERYADFTAGTPLFDYDYSYVLGADAGGATQPKDANPWWNDYRSLNCDPRREWRPLGSQESVQDRYPGAICGPPDDWRAIPCCENPRLPEIVNASFWLMFEAPITGAPDFRRLFSEDVFLSAAYTRRDPV
ncbi:MAG: hypothetical protein GWP08_19795 [Nitrospiraceae bacterium]|nr:hypothetical protein [Nitrospiraceae bacterium]